jgi:HK97 family phage portal protein
LNSIQKAVAKLFNIKQALPTGSGSYAYVNGSLVWMADTSENYIRNGYGANDIVYSAINLVTEKARMPEWELYKVVDEAAMKQYKAALAAKDYKQAAKYRKKSLEEITTFNSRTGRWAELLMWPNENETFGDFVANGAAYKMLTGNKFWWANLLDAGANAGVPIELQALPSQYMTILATLGFPNRVVGYKLMSPELLNFNRETVLHEKYWNPEYYWQGSHLYGQSPLKAALKNLTRNNYAKTASAAKFENGGADGILYVNDDRIQPEEGLEQAKAVKQVLASQYSGASNSGKIATSGFPVGFIKIGDSVVDLNILKAEDLDLRRLANIWGVPSQLLNDPENKTYNNQKEGEKALTQRCVMPHLIATRDHLNKKVQSDWGLKGENVYIDFDADCFQELHEDKAEKWKWVKELPVPEAYKLEMMDLDVPADLPKDLILFDSGKVTLQELLATMDETQLAQIQANLNGSGMIDYESGEAS